ncbi:LysR family transcriptional regulator [Seongchinamella sediminis]|uniref:LysR family transcriptional regulator n=1 Tax=Seongchinamella sediminis TaxID=2283635 RepID=A0A3L7E3G2_9GAMM|nr:LysR family transcriptional regulator [Seongchinamella sediminis]RLQ22993.1 LysR family transcriptional regulator [Seongchinamella sediminis]
MRLDKVDLNLFVVFDTLYRERSVTRVAQRLHLTQPAVSNALNRLRQTFDDPLFVRGPRGMQPTPVADAVSADIQRALALLQKSVGGQHRFDPAESAKVYRVGMNDLAQGLVLPGLQRTLADRAPGVSVHAFYQGRDLSVEQLKAGDLDLLIDVPQLNARELEQVQLGSIPYRLALSATHPLAGKAPDMSDYLGAEHVHVSSRARGRGQVDLALHNRGQRRSVKMRVQHYAVAAAITAGSQLLWTAPASALDYPGLVVCALPFEVEPLALNLYWHRSADQDPANAWMRELLTRQFEHGLLNVSRSRP